MNAESPLRSMLALLSDSPRSAAVLGLALGAVGTPYGYEMLIFPFSLMARSAFSVGLNEWARPDLMVQWPYSLLLLGAGLVFRRADPVRRAWLAVFLGAGLVAWRHATIREVRELPKPDAEPTESTLGAEAMPGRPPAEFAPNK